MANKDVETKVVQVRFDNSKFSKNVEKTIKQCDELDKKLQFKNRSKDIKEVQEAIDKVQTKELNKELEKTDSIVHKITLGFKDLLKLKVLSRVMDTVINRTSALTKNLLGIKNVLAGWQQYEEQVTNVGGILNQVEKKTKEDGTLYGLNDVANAMERLQWYTDETSFNFTTLSNGIRQFVVAGIDLNKAAEAAMGVTNLAGSAKVFDEYKIQSAMNAVSKAMQAGYMDLQKWTTLSQTAGIVTEDFSKALIEEAYAQGKLVKSAGGQYRTKKGGKLVTEENIASTLSQKWLNSNILTNVMNRYSSASTAVETFTGLMAEQTDESLQKINELFKESGVQFTSFEEILAKMPEDITDATDFSAEQAARYLEKLGYQFNELSLKAFKSSQETTSFSQALNYVAGTVRTKWAGIFQSIFGDYDTATRLWSDVSNKFYDIFISPFQHLSDTFEKWSTLSEGGAEDFRKTLLTIIDVVGRFKESIGKAFKEVFGDVDISFLQRMTIAFKNFFDKLKEDDEFFDVIKQIAAALIKIIKIASKLHGMLFKVLGKALEAATPALDSILAAINDILDVIMQLVDVLIDSGLIDFVGDVIVNIIQLLTTVIKNFIHVIKGEDLEDAATNFSEAFKNIFGSLKEVGQTLVGFFNSVLKLVIPILNSALESVAKIIDWFAQKFQEGSFTFAKAVKLFLISMMLIKVAVGIKRFLDVFKVVEAITDLLWVPWELANAFRLKAIGKMILEIAAAVLMIAAAVNMISKINIGSLIKSLIAVGALLGIFIWLTIYLAKLQKTKDKKESTLRFMAIAFSIMLISTAIVILINTMSKMTPGELFKTSLTILIMFAMILLIISGYNKLNNFIKKNKKTNNILKELIGIAFILLSMAVVFKTVSSLQWPEIFKGIVTMLFVFAATAGLIIAVNRSAKGVKSNKIGGTLLSISISLLMISATIKIIANMRGPDIFKALGIILLISILFMSIIFVIKLITRKMDDGQIKNLKKTISIFRTISFSLLILATSLLLLSLVDWKTIGKAFALIVGMFAIIIITSVIVKKFEKYGENMTKTILFMVAISASLLILATSLLLLSLVDWKNIGKAFTLIAGMFTIIIITSVIVKKFEKYGKNMTKTILFMVAISASLLILATSLLIISHAKWEDIGKAFVIIIATLFVILTSIKIFDKIKISGKAILKFISIVLLFSVVFFVLELIIDDYVKMSSVGLDKIAGAFILISGIVLAMLGMMKTIDIITKTGKMSAKTFGILFLIIGMTIIFIKLMALASKQASAKLWAGMAIISVSVTIILGIIYAFVGLTKLIKEDKDLGKNSLKLMMVVGLMIIAIYGIIGAIAIIASMQWQKAWLGMAIVGVIMAGLIIMIFALVGAAALVKKASMEILDIVLLGTIMAVIAVSILAISAAMLLISMIPEDRVWPTFLVIAAICAVAILMMVAIIGMAKMLKNSEATFKDVGVVLLVLVGVLASILVLAFSFQMLANIKEDRLLAAVKALIVMLTVITVIIAILAAIAGTGVGFAAMAGVALILVAISAAILGIAASIYIIAKAIDQLVNSFIKLSTYMSSKDPAKALEEYRSACIQAETASVNFKTALVNLGGAIVNFASANINMLSSAAKAIGALFESAANKKKAEGVIALADAYDKLAKALDKINYLNVGYIDDQLKLLADNFKNIDKSGIKEFKTSINSLSSSITNFSKKDVAFDRLLEFIKAYDSLITNGHTYGFILMDLLNEFEYILDSMKDLNEFVITPMFDFSEFDAGLEYMRQNLAQYAYGYQSEANSVEATNKQAKAIQNGYAGVGTKKVESGKTVNVTINEEINDPFTMGYQAQRILRNAVSSALK